jgi:hypothetical protein
MTPNLRLFANKYNDHQFCAITDVEAGGTPLHSPTSNTLLLPPPRASMLLLLMLLLLAVLLAAAWYP